MPELVVVCEAPAEPELDPSHEKAVLAALLNEHSVDGVDILGEGCGGSAGAGAVAAYIAGVRGPGVFVAHVVDRDYQPYERADESFSDGERRFIWRRHEFENYLLQPEVIATAMERLSASLAARPGGAPEWADRLPRTTDEARALLEACAEARVAIEAVEMVVWQIQQELNAVGRVQFAAPARSGSGPPPGADACAEWLRGECRSIIETLGNLAACDVLDPDGAERRYRHRLAELGDARYVDCGGYLRDFAGKELLVCLHQRLMQECGARLSRADLHAELAGAMLPAYRMAPDLFEPDDFRELTHGVRSMAGLSPARSR